MSTAIAAQSSAWYLGTPSVAVLPISDSTSISSREPAGATSIGTLLSDAGNVLGAALLSSAIGLGLKTAELTQSTDGAYDALDELLEATGVHNRMIVYLENPKAKYRHVLLGCLADREEASSPDFDRYLRTILHGQDSKLARLAALYMASTNSNELSEFLDDATDDPHSIAELLAYRGT